MLVGESGGLPTPGIAIVGARQAVNDSPARHVLRDCTGCDGLPDRPVSTSGRGVIA